MIKVIANSYEEFRKIKVALEESPKCPFIGNYCLDRDEINCKNCISNNIEFLIEDNENINL